MIHFLGIDWSIAINPGTFGPVLDFIQTSTIELVTKIPF